MSKQSGAHDSTVSSRFSRPVGWLQNLPIWIKLALIMIVPTIATIVVGARSLTDHASAANDAERVRALAVLASDADALIDDLQQERAIGTYLLSAPPQSLKRVRDDFARQLPVTDKSSAQYRLSRSTVADVPGNLRVTLGRIETELVDLTTLRSQISEQNKIPLSIAGHRYRVLISDLLTIRSFTAEFAGDPVLGDRLRAVTAVAQAKEFLAQERDILLPSLARREPISEATRRNFVAVRKAQQLALDAFAAAATSTQRATFQRTIASTELGKSLKFEGQVDSLAVAEPPPPSLTADAWDTTMSGRSKLMNAAVTEFGGQAQQTAIDVGDEVEQQVLIETTSLIATLVFGVIFAWLVARSMARSLRDLRQGALAVAQYGLPQAVNRLRDPHLPSSLSPAEIAMHIAEPLPVRSTDEFGQVTQAFNAVHMEAVRTAAEQAQLRSSVAAMFINLARRSQLLVDRLIGHLDQLERGEQDPDRLSELFQLDHLATRMRRNDENLLVLAGADSSRVQRDPAALLDVLRAAQSEVEHYTRIQFGGIDQHLEISAPAVNDFVHLIAELFDNATAFSPPDTPIVVDARRHGEHAILQVHDRGIGMSGEQYAELNERLVTPPQVDAAVSRMMGLVVVAQLAHRHGARVELRPAPERGTIAEVIIPSGALVPGGQIPTGHAPSGAPTFDPGENSHPFFAPPLALESGSVPGPMWASAVDHPPIPLVDPIPTSGSPFGAPRSGSPFGAPTSGSPFGASPFSAPTAGLVPHQPGPAEGGSRAFGGPEDQPSYGEAVFAQPPFTPPAGPPTQRPAGLGSAFGGDPAAPFTNGGFTGSDGAARHANGRGTQPTWHDLTGAEPDGQIGEPMPASVQPPDTDPLPQRRPGSQWGVPEDVDQLSNPGVGSVAQTPVSGSGFATEPEPPMPLSPLTFGGGTFAPPPLSTPVIPLQSPGPVEQADPFGATAWQPSGQPGVFTGPGQTEPPATGGWGAPESFEPFSRSSATTRHDSLDEVTSVMQRLTGPRDSGVGESPWGDRMSPAPVSHEIAPSQYADDLTMELPIFQELESAWFRPPAPNPDSGDVGRTAAGAPMSSRMVDDSRSSTWPDASPVPTDRELSFGSGDGSSGFGARGASEPVSWRSIADQGWRAAEAASSPEDGGTTDNGLPRRVPQAQLVPGGVEVATSGSERRSPDAVRGLLSAYHRGVQRGRGVQASTAEPATAGSSTSGKEQDA